MSLKVAIFWDYENCSPPSNSSGLGYHIVNNISRIARPFGSVTTFRAYLDISAQSSKSVLLRSELQSSGVSMVDCPHNGKKDVADKMLLVDMLAFAVDHPAPATILLITGDRDYAYAVSTLKLRKYQVILVVPSSPHTPPSLESQASLVIDWSAAVLKTRTETVNSTQTIRQPFVDLDTNHVTRLLRELQDLPLDPDANPHPYSTASLHTPSLRRVNARDLLEPSRHCKDIGNFDPTLEFTPNPASPRKCTSVGSELTPGGLPIPKTPSRSRRASISTGSTRARSTTSVVSPPPVEHDSHAKNPSPSKSAPDVTEAVGPAESCLPLPSLDTLELPLHTSCPPSSIIIRSPLEPSRSMGDVPVPEKQITGKPGTPSSHKPSCLASPFGMAKPLSGVKPVPSSCSGQSHTAVKSTTPIAGPTKTLPGAVSSVRETQQVKDIGVPEENEHPAGLRIEGGGTILGRSILYPTHSEESSRDAADMHESNYFPYVKPRATYSPGLTGTPSGKHVSSPAVTPFGVDDGIDSHFAASSHPSDTLSHSTSRESVLSSSVLPPTPFPLMESREHDESERDQMWMKFKPLIHLLLAARQRGIARPSRSIIATDLVQSDKQVYQRAGVSRFRDYTALAEQAGIIELGGREAGAWIGLHPNWFGVDGTAHFFSDRDPSPSPDPPKAIQDPLLPDPKTPPMGRTAIFRTPTFTPPNFNSLASNYMFPISPTNRQDNTSWASIPAQFQPLIDILVQTRAEGSSQILRSVAGQLLSQDVYARAGVSGFREYVNQASEAQLVQFGGVGGYAWICLHPELRI